MERIFVPVPNNSFNNEPSIINRNWPRFKVISNDNITVNSLLVPCILSSVKVEPTGVFRFFCDNRFLTWERVNNIPFRPLTKLTNSPEYAVTRNFRNSIKTDMNFRHCLSPYCFGDQVVTSCMGFLIKRIVVHFRSHGNRRRRFFCFIKQRNKKLVCFDLIYRYLLPWTFFVPSLKGLWN